MQQFNIFLKTVNFLPKGPKRGALNPNSVLCTDQAPSPGFCALNPGSALNPRNLNAETTVLFTSFSLKSINYTEG